MTTNDDVCDDSENALIALFSEAKSEPFYDDSGTSNDNLLEDEKKTRA